MQVKVKSKVFMNKDEWGWLWESWSWELLQGMIIKGTLKALKK